MTRAFDRGQTSSQGGGGRRCMTNVRVKLAGSFVPVFLLLERSLFFPSAFLRHGRDLRHLAWGER